MSEAHDTLVALVRRGGAPFLREGPPGRLRVGGTNVLFDTLVERLRDGAVPEAIAEDSLALELDDVLAVADLIRLQPAGVQDHLNRLQREDFPAEEIDLDAALAAADRVAEWRKGPDEDLLPPPEPEDPAERWQSTPDVYDLAKLLDECRAHASQRKLRLCVVALCRRSKGSLLRRGPVRDALDVADRYEDGQATEEELKGAWNAMSAVPAWSPVMYAASPGLIVGDVRWAIERTWDCYPRTDVPPQPQCGFLRCIFGNPFLPPFTVSPEMLAHNDGAVVKLATVIYEERDPQTGLLDLARLAILADALEEAGVDDRAALEHLRGPGPHCRGCHVVDAVLGRE